MDYVYGNYLPAYPVQALILEAAWNTGSLATLDKTLQWASEHGVRAIVMGCVPEYDAPLAQLVAYSIDGISPACPAGIYWLKTASSSRVYAHSSKISGTFSLCRFTTFFARTESAKSMQTPRNISHGWAILITNLLGARYVISQIVNSGQLR